MGKLFIVAGFIIATSVFSFAQTILDPACPTISVTGPAGILDPGGVGVFTVEVANADKDSSLEYVWTVNSGDIVRGQGTTKVDVKTSPTYSSLVVTVTVKGLPADCPISASERIAGCEGLPISVKLAEFDGSLFKGDKFELNKIAGTLNDNPNDQLYVYFAYKAEPARQTDLSREDSIVNHLGTAIGDRTRITVERHFGRVDLIQFWRVPPGADNPVCNECDEPSCLPISVIGPAGVTEIGGTMKFTASPSPKNFEKLSYKWTISAGTIIEGQGKPWITVQTTHEMSGETVTAKVEVIGLSESCSRTAEETALVARGIDTFPSDEFEKLHPKLEKERLDVFLTVLSNEKDDKGFIVLNFTKGTTEAKLRRRIRRIEDHIFLFRKFPKARMVLLTRNSKNESTVLWQVPPGADESICSDCNKN